MLRAMREAGIEVEVFNPVHKYISRIYFNYRDHRKITVIDGYVAYTGGINIGDEYANRVERFGHWKDSAVRLEGDGAWGLAALFMQMWKMLGRSFPNEDDFYRPRREGPKTEGFCQPFEDGPLNNPDDPVEAAYVQLIASALDGIPGLGTKRQAELKRRLGTIRAIREADEETLVAILPKNTAHAVWLHFHEGNTAGTEHTASGDLSE